MTNFGAGAESRCEGGRGRLRFGVGESGEVFRKSSDPCFFSSLCVAVSPIAFSVIEAGSSNCDAWSIAGDGRGSGMRKVPNSIDLLFKPFLIGEPCPAASFSSSVTKPIYD